MIRIVEFITQVFIDAYSKGFELTVWILTRPSCLKLKTWHCHFCGKPFLGTLSETIVCIKRKTLTRIISGWSYFTWRAFLAPKWFSKRRQGKTKPCLLCKPLKWEMTRCSSCFTLAITTLYHGISSFLYPVQEQILAHVLFSTLCTFALEDLCEHAQNTNLLYSSTNFTLRNDS